MRKKVLCAMLAAAMVTTSLAGCGSSDKSGENGGKNGQVTINLYQNKSEIASQLEAAAKTYMEQNPDVKINVESIQGNDYNTNLKAKLLNKDSVDIYAAGDKLDNLLEYTEDLSDQPWVENVVDGSLDDMTRDGKVYGLPVGIEGYGLVYNKDIFEAAGIDAEKLTSYDAIDKAFADLQEQIDSGKLSEQFPALEAVEEYAAKESWIPGLHTLNVALANEFSSASELWQKDSIELIYADALKDLVDLETKYTTSKDNLALLNAVDYSSQIGGGIAIERVAVVQQGNWIGPEVKGISEEMSEKLGMLPIPLKGVNEDNIATGISIYWCVNSQSSEEKKQASKDFLNWLFQSDDGKKIIIDDCGFIPAFTNYDGIEISDPLSKEVQRYINEGKTMPWVMNGFPSGYETQSAADFQGYFNGDYDWNGCVEKLKKDFKELKAQ